jgi:glycosyltransferase involved in cell wall biosynthesis
VRERRRIAIVAHGIHDDGGMERAFAELIRRTNGRHELVVLSSDLDEGLRPLVEWRRVPVPRRPAALRFAVFYVLAAIRLELARFDLAHTLGAIVPNHVQLASVHFSNVGYVRSVGGFAPPHAPLVRRVNTGLARLLGLLAERWSYRPGRVGCLAPVSDGLARELARSHPGIPIRVAPNGVDRTRFRPDPAARAETRGEVRASDGDVVVLFVGGDWHGKGLALAVDAVARIDRALRLRLVVVGRGDAAYFRRRAEALGAADRVVFTGPRRDVERFYAAADVFLLPSVYETFSLAAFEAASSGLPVVAPRLHGIDELVGDDVGGLIVERDADAIARALVALAESPELRRRLGAAAAERAAAFTWERSAAVLDDLYAELAGGVAA